ncbi:MAG: hypothetical protein EPO68_12590 [Planctomycetota bacterium]|nr:MAG: hypothetical protein EPO68_12590 [Planctomycetota bacterium]
MSDGREELARRLREARAELARVVALLERGAAPQEAGANRVDAALAAVAALSAGHGGAPLDASARHECAALLDLVGVARQLAGAQIERARAELGEVRAVRTRLGRQRERLERLTARNCDVSA